jgi:hypothetical protein
MDGVQHETTVTISKDAAHNIAYANVPGKYEVVYSCTDPLTSRTVKQTVPIIVGTHPVLVLTGDSFARVTRGLPFNDEGISCIDLEYGSIHEMPLGWLQTLRISSVTLSGDGRHGENANVFTVTDGGVGCEDCLVSGYRAPQSQQACEAKSTSTADPAFNDDNFGGWYDVQGCGRCFDYCRWVGSNGAGGDPAFRLVHGGSYWSCRLAGGSGTTGIEYFQNQFKQINERWPFKKCSGEGAQAPFPQASKVHGLQDWRIQVGRHYRHLDSRSCGITVTGGNVIIKSWADGSIASAGNVHTVSEAQAICDYHSLECKGVVVKKYDGFVSGLDGLIFWFRYPEDHGMFRPNAFWNKFQDLDWDCFVADAPLSGIGTDSTMCDSDKRDFPLDGEIGFDWNTCHDSQIIDPGGNPMFGGGRTIGSYSKDPWWQIDLGVTKMIGSVIVSPRKDSCQGLLLGSMTYLGSDLCNGHDGTGHDTSWYDAADQGASIYVADTPCQRSPSSECFGTMCDRIIRANGSPESWLGGFGRLNVVKQGAHHYTVRIPTAYMTTDGFTIERDPNYDGLICDPTHKLWELLLPDTEWGPAACMKNVAMTPHASQCLIGQTPLITPPTGSTAMVASKFSILSGQGMASLQWHSER